MHLRVRASGRRIPRDGLQMPRPLVMDVKRSRVASLPGSADAPTHSYRTPMGRKNNPNPRKVKRF